MTLLGARFKLMVMKIGVLGAGKMGEILIESLLTKSGYSSKDIFASVHSTEAKRRLENQFKIQVFTDNRELVRHADWILLCVKPQQACDVLQGLQAEFESRHHLLSVCASISLAKLREWSGGTCPVVRAMPNTPSKIALGMTVLCCERDQDHRTIDGAKRIFGSVGETLQIDEKLMDVATAVSGCGPAYVYLIIEALSDAGIALGLPRESSTLLAAQTLYGAAKMVLETKIHPAELRDQVMTPGGVTIDGVMALEQGNLRSVLLKGVTAAAEKSRKLNEQMSF